MSTVAADDGCRLWVEDKGHGTPVVLCHGGPGLWDMFAPVAEPLSEHVRVIRWDQRGCGRSERRGPYSVSRSLADLDAVRSCLGLDRVVVAGHSWGATLALRYALDDPDRVSALVYSSGTGLGWDWREPFNRAAAERLAPYRDRMDELRAQDRERELAILQWSAEFTTDDAMSLAEQMATPWFGISRECHETIWGEVKRTWREPELVAACRTLTVPTLIIDGAQDLRPRWGVDSLAQALPNVSRVVLPDAGHVPWLDAPGEFRAALLDFLRARLVPARRLLGHRDHADHLGLRHAEVEPDRLRRAPLAVGKRPVGHADPDHVGQVPLPGLDGELRADPMQRGPQRLGRLLEVLIKSRLVVPLRARADDHRDRPLPRRRAARVAGQQHRRGRGPHAGRQRRLQLGRGRLAQHVGDVPGAARLALDVLAHPGERDHRDEEQREPFPPGPEPVLTVTAAIAAVEGALSDGAAEDPPPEED